METVGVSMNKKEKQRKVVGCNGVRGSPSPTAAHIRVVSL
jgi:hypothetical protein